MNERIRQLADEAAKFSAIMALPTGESGDKLFVEKFAKLILIEVTDILSTYRGKVVFTDGAEYNYQHPIIAIRKHFGVEE